jgi:formate dehydrogenase gamma subunit
MRLAMSIDLDLCVGCQACVSACKEQWDSGPGAARDWVHTIETGTRGKDLAVTFYPGLCMQCEAHPCTAGCPTGATYADPRTGVVVVNGDVCIGCGSCVAGCPYGARHVDPVKKVVEKCNLCSPFVARGELPACVATCPAECRVFGDLDDPASSVSRAVREKNARPLVAAAIDVGPKISYAGDVHRERIIAAGAVRAPEESGLTKAWRATLPAVREVVPAVGLAFVGGGLLVNLKARADRVKREEAGRAAATADSGVSGAEPPMSMTAEPAAASGASERAEGAAARISRKDAKKQRGFPLGTFAPLRESSSSSTASLARHTVGIRLLHWFNALSWLLLLATGTGLMSAPGFAIFGTRFPRLAAGLSGGVERLIRFHVLWGLLWAAATVPLFLLVKKGPREVLREVRLTRDDLTWFLAKPLAMAGLRRQPLPPQDKYNAGQKIFAILVLVATAVIVASGLVMAFHLGPARVVAGAIVAHELAIALVLVGIAVHLTMAAVIAEERPALRGMLTGRIDYEHARHHSPKWVAEIAGRTPAGGEGERT